jgi:hypothetical protein
MECSIASTFRLDGTIPLILIASSWAICERIPAERSFNIPAQSKPIWSHVRHPNPHNRAGDHRAAELLLIYSNSRVTNLKEVLRGEMHNQNAELRLLIERNHSEMMLKLAEMLGRLTRIENAIRTPNTLYLPQNKHHPPTLRRPSAVAVLPLKLDWLG